MKHDASITVELCMGSACFARGNRKTADELNTFLAEEGLDGRVEIKGALCEGMCEKGPVVKINGTPLYHASTTALIERLRKLLDME